LPSEREWKDPDDLSSVHAAAGSSLDRPVPISFLAFVCFPHACFFLISMQVAGSVELPELPKLPNIAEIETQKLTGLTRMIADRKAKNRNTAATEEHGELNLREFSIPAIWHFSC